MKSTLLIFISVLTTATLISCSGDELDQMRSAELNVHENNFIYDSQLVGQWDLSAIVSATPVDLNADGELNTNLVSETECFQPMSLIFNGNKTFTAVNVQLDLREENDEDTFSCVNGVSKGIWSLKDDILSMIVTVGNKKFETKKQLFPTDNTFQFEVNRLESKDYVKDHGGTSASGMSIIYVEYTRVKKF